MAELLRLHKRLFGMTDRKSVEDAVSEAAGWLAAQGVKFAISLGKTGLDVIEVVGRRKILLFQLSLSISQRIFITSEFWRNAKHQENG